MHQKLKRYATSLGNAFRNAYSGGIDLGKLYEFGENISTQLAADVVKHRISEDDEGYDLLTWATGITHQLHDAGARQHFMENPQELDEYSKMLLGEKEPVFSFGSDTVNTQK